MNDLRCEKTKCIGSRILEMVRDEFLPPISSRRTSSSDSLFVSFTCGMFGYLAIGGQILEHHDHASIHPFLSWDEQIPGGGTLYESLSEMDFSSDVDFIARELVDQMITIVRQMRNHQLMPFLLRMKTVEIDCTKLAARIETFPNLYLCYSYPPEVQMKLVQILGRKIIVDLRGPCPELFGKELSLKKAGMFR